MKTHGKDFLVSERPRTKRWVPKSGGDKHRRYRQRLIAEGKCPHCGKPCAPYSECEARRLAKKMTGVLNLMVRRGQIRKLSRGVYACIEASGSTQNQGQVKAYADGEIGKEQI